MHQQCFHERFTGAIPQPDDSKEWFCCKEHKQDFEEEMAPKRSRPDERYVLDALNTFT